MQAIKSNKDFNTVVTQDKPVLLDFYADWCGPCRALMPTVEKLAKEYKGKVEIRKINVDEQQEIAAKFNVRSIPSLFFLKDRKVMHSMKGAASENELKKHLDKLLKD